MRRWDSGSGLGDAGREGIGDPRSSSTARASSTGEVVDDDFCASRFSRCSSAISALRLSVDQQYYHGGI